MKLKIFSTIILLIMFLCLYLYRPAKVYEGFVFGTYYVIKSQSSEDISKDIKKVFASTNKTMSIFNEKSELNFLNKNTQISASPDLAYILNISKSVYKKSGGAFDPTLSPLIELWGFGVNKQKKHPTKAEVSKALLSVGFNKIDINENIITKQNINTSINLSAIAKGFAVDKISEMMDSKNIKNYLIDIGGEVKVRGKNRGKLWRVGVADPSHSSKNIDVLELSNVCVATSGDYHNYVMRDGKKYSHTINAKTGFPIVHNIASVSVLNVSCTLADAYATAIMAMEEENSLEFIKQNELNVILIKHSGEVMRINKKHPIL